MAPTGQLDWLLTEGQNWHNVFVVVVLYQVLANEKLVFGVLWVQTPQKKKAV